MANHNLTTPNGVTDYMAESTTADDWNARTEAVKKANSGYPAFWYSTIVESGFVTQVAAKWGGSGGISIVSFNR